MNILFLDWKCFLRDDTIAAMEELGHRVIPFIHKDYDEDSSEEFNNAFSATVEKNSVSLVFSYNYYPLLAICCRDVGLPYVSFLYDSPYVRLFSYTLAFPTNTVYVFDSSIAELFRRGGLTNVHYLCLPADTRKTKRLSGKKHDSSFTRSDISFIGALYNEAHNFYDRLETDKDPYLKNYLEGLMAGQSLVYGDNFLERALTPDIIDRLEKRLPYKPSKNSIADVSYVYANYFLARKLTSIERIKFLSALGGHFGKKYNLKLYTLSPAADIKGFDLKGIAGYDSDMVHIFRESKINLNISLRSISTGIPLRCMDILAAGGFLLTNYQSDMEMEFTAGEDYVYFESREDLLEKAEYYLTHESERREIAENGAKKAEDEHSMELTFERILKEFR